MTFAQGSRTDLSYIVESTFGSTPGSPAMISIPYKSHSLNLSKERVQGADLLSDRIPRVDRHGNRQVAGDIVVDLRADDYDDFIESAMFNTFASSGASTLKIGTTPQFMTIEDSANDITQFRQFTGMSVSTMSVSIAPNQMVEATFSMVGKDMTQAQSALDSDPTDSSGNEPFDSFNGSISDGGSAIAIVSSIEFSITNALAPTFVVGSDSTPQLEFGQAVVEGQLTAYYEDASLIDKFINETGTSIQIVVDDTASGGSYTFDFPNVKYNAADVPVDGPASRIITLPFVSLWDATEQTNFKLTKA